MIVRKGCLNEKCIARRKKIKYKDPDDYYCSKCGLELFYVCATKGCYSRLEDDSKPYCDTCLEKQRQRKQKAADAAMVVPKAVGAAAVIAGPKLIDIAIDVGKKAISKK